MHSLRLLVLLGVLLATQGRVVDQEKISEMVASPADIKPLEVQQELANEIRETQPLLIGPVNTPEIPAKPISEAIKPEEVKETQPQVANSTKALDIKGSPSQMLSSNNSPVAPSQAINPVEVTKGNQESQSQLVNSISSEVAPSVAIKPVVVEPEVNQESQSQLSNSISSQVASADASKPVEVEPEVKKDEPVQLSITINSEGVQAGIEEKPSTSNEITKEHEIPKEHSAKKGRDNKIQFAYEQPSQTLNQNQLLSVQDLEKIFKYQEVQVINGSQPLGQYQSHFNKFQSYPKVEYVSVVNTSEANVTHHIHNHTHYYPNQKKPGFPFSFPFPFLPNPFEKYEPTYVNVNLTANSTANVTQHTHIYEETKPFPFLPNPFTDFPKVVGLSLVLLPNPFFVNKSQGQPQVVNLPAGYQESGEYQYFGKFRAFSEEPQKQQQPQKPSFYLIPNPLANQVANEGQKGEANVLLPVNLAALPLLVPAPEVFQGKASSSGSISFQDLMKASNVHVSQPLKLQANNGMSQIQKEQAAIHQLILNHLGEQTKLFQKQSLGDGKSSQHASPVGVQEEEESSVLFAVEIPKPIYRFFKGIFGGFSN
ncbi:uncharacterized protein LOC108146166 [Drosophila elegans]|uniref:uncharacterized protein LOC108146166 n=1 Tax=Drosophila elegans TaxID=30023 RepID=UPI0007E76B79|nr:uncharacterized protein LOC108146166 [Drosophila elegans]